MTRYEDFERERLDQIYDIIAPYSQMGRNERSFLNGIIRCEKPKKILEVGIANGGGSAIILNAIKDIDGAELYSADYSLSAWSDPGKKSGWLVEEKFPDLMDKWHVYRGGDISRFIEDIGTDIDMLVLDTVHTHPWETLNFLCILPFMKNGSYTLLHDISIFTQPSLRHALACRYLFASVVSDEKITPSPEGGNFANMGVFKVSEVTVKHIDNLFEELLIPWNMRVPERDIADMKEVMEKHYSHEQYKFFCDVLDLQEYMFTHSRSLVSVLKGGLQERAAPWLYALLQKAVRQFRRVK